MKTTHDWVAQIGWSILAGAAIAWNILFGAAVAVTLWQVWQDSPFVLVLGLISVMLIGVGWLLSYPIRRVMMRNQIHAEERHQEMLRAMRTR